MSNYKTYRASLAYIYSTPVGQMIRVYRCDIGDYHSAANLGDSTNLVLINGRLGPAGL